MRVSNSFNAALKSSLWVLWISFVLACLNACKPTNNDSAQPVANSAVQNNGVTDAANAELKWARAALERNPHLKVLGVDESAHTIQVQIKNTGETVSLSPGELAALPISDFLTQPSGSVSPPETVAADAEVASAPTASSASSSAQAKYDYQVERSQNRIRVTGPGVSIESSGAAPRPGSDKSAATDSPVLCTGQRLMHINNRNLNVDGDAIVARDGCELHITNSHIAATGSAVIVEDAAVHIDNSDIKGVKSSLTTAPASRLYLRHSTFSGLVRRDPQAVIQDQGDNTWR